MTQPESGLWERMETIYLRICKGRALQPVAAVPDQGVQLIRRFSPKGARLGGPEQRYGGEGFT